MSAEVQEFIGLAFLSAGTITIIMAFWTREMTAEAFIEHDPIVDPTPMQPFTVQNL